MSKKSKPKNKSIITEFAAPVTVKADEVLAISSNTGKAIKPKPKPVKEITLATLHNFSSQQVFNYVARHLLEQSERSVDVITAHCFGGVYWPSTVKVPKAHQKLMAGLQGLHDSWPAHLWLEKLKALALNFKLSTSQLAFYFWNAELCRYQHRSWRVLNLGTSTGIKGDRFILTDKTFEIIGQSLHPIPKSPYTVYLVREISR